MRRVTGVRRLLRRKQCECLWAWQWSDALTLEDGFPGDTGPWAEFGGPSDPPAVEFFDYDDLGIDDDDFG